jgi:hypothetical protein
MLRSNAKNSKWGYFYVPTFFLLFAVAALGFQTLSAPATANVPATPAASVRVPYQPPEKTAPSKYDSLNVTMDHWQYTTLKRTGSGP